MAAGGRTEARSTGRRRRGAHTPEVRLLHGECAEAMAGMPEASVEAVVTDPPYGIDWQGESWDGRAIREAAARSGGERFSPNEAFQFWCRGWAEECLRVMRPGAHLLGFGSPRTWHRLTAGLEDAGFEIRDTLIWLYGSGMPKSRRYPGDRASALKPAFEPIVLARKPLEGTLAENVARHGTGLLETGACRIEGRHPADVAIGHAEGCGEGACVPGCPVAEADATAGTQLPPSRFLHCPKADRAERDAGCEEMPERDLDLFPNARRADKAASPARNSHPSVKPIELMRWLVRLGCPSGGLLLDPFMGSGTTGIAAVFEGRRFCGIEREADYLEIARARIAHHGGRVADGGRLPLGRRRGTR
ncbi:MAG: site-specific DNA-methyltransferase [Actinobacteria bacterium]|nr:site-specific DNA-methyltransferase [Actinomycetota bacterium]